MNHPVNTSVIVNAVVVGKGGFPQEPTTETLGYIRRIAELENMLKEQIAYKEALVAAHVREIARLCHQPCIA